LIEEIIKQHMPKNYSSKGKGKTNYNLLQNHFTNRFTNPSSLINKIQPFRTQNCHIIGKGLQEPSHCKRLGKPCPAAGPRTR